jgi:hypothetical protein
MDTTWRTLAKLHRTWRSPLPLRPPTGHDMMMESCERRAAALVGLKVTCQGVQTSWIPSREQRIMDPFPFSGDVLTCGDVRLANGLLRVSDVFWTLVGALWSSSRRPESVLSSVCDLSSDYLRHGRRVSVLSAQPVAGCRLPVPSSPPVAHQAPPASPGGTRRPWPLSRPLTEPLDSLREASARHARNSLNFPQSRSGQAELHLPDTTHIFEARVFLFSSWGR